jgi:beta-glucosidase
VHSGPEADRHRFDARVSEHDLRDSYLPHFEMAFRQGKAQSVMCAYNSIAGEPACSNGRLLGDILRGEWGFGGYVVTDCGAVRDVWRDHKVVPTREEAAARAVKAGTDLECGGDFKALPKAVAQKLITEAEIDRAVGRLFAMRFRLGMFDPPEMVPWAQIPYSVNDSAPHRALALEAARKSLVLVENRGGLPLRAGLKKIAVIGPTADSGDVLLGNYNGTPSKQVTIVDGIRAEAQARGAEVTFARGSELVGDDASHIAEAVTAAKGADAVVLVLGLSPRLEGEEGERKENPSGDRKDIGLPAIQDKLLGAVLGARKPTVLVLTGGSAIALGPARARLGAVLLSWYPGEEGGTAVADALFGKVSPGGRLPVTFYKSADDLPAFSDYAMKGRTYRYFDKEPQWPFGHGLSYTTFKYGNLRVTPERVTLDVENTGKREGDEVVQLYLARDKAPPFAPLRWLAGFQRVTLRPGDRQAIAFALDPQVLGLVDEQGRRQVAPGRLLIAVGARQPGKGHRYASPRDGVAGALEVK